jgi:hypothetical protein
LAPITATEAAFICPSFSAQKSSQKDKKEPNLLLVNRFIRYNKRVKLFIGLAFILAEFLGLSRERARERERKWLRGIQFRWKSRTRFWDGQLSSHGPSVSTRK